MGGDRLGDRETGFGLHLDDLPPCQELEVITLRLLSPHGGRGLEDTWLHQGNQVRFSSLQANGDLTRPALRVSKEKPGKGKKAP